MAGFDHHRALPCATEAEKGLLSSFFINPRYVGDLCAEKGITKDHFHIPNHAMIFDVLAEFHRENEVIDFIIISQFMRDNGTILHAGGDAFITEVFTFVETAANATEYVEIVLEKYTLREFIKTFTEYAAKGYDEQDDVPGLLGSAVDAVMKIVKLGEGKRIHTRDMKELMIRAMERIDKRTSGDWKVEMPTGIRALDKATLGFLSPMVTAIIGKPSDGKSSLAMNIAEHLALKCGKRVGIISLDDSDDQVSDRLIQQFSRVNLFEIKRTGQFGLGDHEALLEAAKTFGNASDRLFIRDDGGLTPAEMDATFATWKTRHGLDIGIIDHIQLARGDGKTRGKTEEAEQVSRALKPMAKRFGIPLIVLSQVTEDKHNAGSYSTKNSKALEEDSNNVWTLKRIPDSTDAWINISKQKDGPRDVNVPVSYLAHCTRFTDRDEGTAEQPDLVHMGAPAKKGRK